MSAVSEMDVASRNRLDDVVEEDEEEGEDWEYEEVEETESEDEEVDKQVEETKFIQEGQNGHRIENNKVEEQGESEKTENGHNGQEGGEENGRHHRERRRHSDRNGDDDGSERKHRHHKKHKKSRHMERMQDAFIKSREAHQNGDSSSSSRRSKRIHVRSKDPLKIARQIEKSLNAAPKPHKGGGNPGLKGKPIAPPPMKVCTICKVCGKEPYVVERVVAEKSWWHKTCFRCKECGKILNLDTYMSHEGVIYCKPHHRELFQPKVVQSDLVDVSGKKKGNKKKADDILAEMLAEEQCGDKKESIVSENDPEEPGRDVVRAEGQDKDKYAGLENLDVGSKFKMFEEGKKKTSSDRYGIMEKLKRLQEGEDLDDLLAEIDEELPDTRSPIPTEPTEEEAADEAMTAVQKKVQTSDALFPEDGKERRERLAADRKRELKELREKLMAGTRDACVDQFGDLLNASANKVRKTKVDVRSENAKRFRDMFDKGEVPEQAAVTAVTGAEKTIMDKEAELEMMRRTKRQQKEFFKKMESGQLDAEASAERKEPKLLIKKITKTEDGESPSGEVPAELTSLSNRFSFFENFDEKDAKKPSKRATSPEKDADVARKECKATNVLSKFKEMETKMLNGEDQVKPPPDPDQPIISDLGFLGRLRGAGERRPLKRFTPPRKLHGGHDDDGGSDYSDSDSYTDSEDYSDSDSYTSSYTGSESEDEEDETLQAIRNTARAQKLRAQFEAWEKTHDAKEQEKQIQMVHDENGASLETASLLKARFEALQLREQQQEDEDREERGKFQPKRFK